ncbi:MAG: hypothetical protein HDR23_05490 [Lachnospiraceae bacterium]|nr:hypothetical protein [Lachnospiraceae bacterium]
MAKKTVPEVKEEQKVLTKYDKKMAARKAKEEADKREEKIFKIVSTIIGILLAVAIVGGIGSTIINRMTAINGTYIMVGDRKVSKLEFDYYYNETVNNYINSYGSFLPYMGLDVNQDFADQAYDENMTWKDMFDQMTVQQMIQVYALADDARANGFTYDDTDDYTLSTDGFKQAAEAAGVSVSEYYKDTFGQYASQSRVAPFLKEEILAAAYYNDLIASNAPSEEEIVAYYQENTQNYDKVDYRSFIFNADIAEDASEDDIAKAMEDIKKKAESFMMERSAGSDFEELCIKNAPEESKADYEDEDTEYCLKEGQHNSYIPSAISGWLYDEVRKEGDIEVIESADYHQYYVVEFLNRYYDAAESDASISSLLASDSTSEYISGLTEKYEVNDIKGKLKYLNIDTTAQTDTLEEEAETEEPSENE